MELAPPLVEKVVAVATDPGPLGIPVDSEGVVPKFKTDFENVHNRAGRIGPNMVALLCLKNLGSHSVGVKPMGYPV